MSEQSTPAQPFFKPLPEHDDLQSAYLLWKIAEAVRPVASGCWEWQHRKNGDGYAILEMDGKRQVVSRVVHRLCVGPLPDGVLALHRCDNPPCLNPAHLFAGDYAANNRDCVAKGRHSSLKLSDAQVIDIRARASTGKRGVLKALAAEHGVSLATIQRVITGDGRHHLDPAAGMVDFTSEQRADAAMTLRGFRATEGLTQEEVGQLLGFTKGYISRVESGKREACNALIVNLNAMLKGGAA